MAFARREFGWSMRLRLNPRPVAMFGRWPRLTIVSAFELALLALIAIQAARLAWILVNPISPVGDYKGRTLPAAFASTAISREFDPFFRLAQAAGPAIVTALN